MVGRDAVHHGQAVRIEHPGLGAEMPQQPFGFKSQQAAVGLRPERAVQQQDARRMA
jgi:hypothetical protein